MLIFRRLLGFLRPYKRGVRWSFALAFGAMGATVLIPYLTGRAIDAIRDHDNHGLWVWAIAIAVAGLARLGLSVFRRLVAGRVSLGVEVDLRNLLYARLQQLELSFFDRQQTGQLMSRATVDLQAVRFFLGYGLIYIAQSLLSLLLAAVAMFALQPGLAALALAPLPFVVLIAFSYGRRSRPALQEVQQRIAELTAEAEENISGVRVVKAFAQEHRQLARFRGSVARVFDQAIYATKIQGDLRPADQLLAEHRAGADPVRRRPPGHPRHAHARPVHRLLRLSADPDLAHADARLHAERRSARHRLGRAHLPSAGSRASDHEPRASSRAAARPRQGAAARSRADVRWRAASGTQ